MSTLLDSYRRNAQAAELEAETSTLPNIRGRALLAVERWAEMADRLERVEELGKLRAVGIVHSGPA